MSRLREATAALRARPGLAAIVCLGIAWGLVMHSMGWAQLAHYAQIRSLADGNAEIDRYHWSTNDKAYVDGHFYSVKSPGVAGLSLPFYLAIDGLGGKDLARDGAINARDTAHPHWTPPRVIPLENYGYDYDRGRKIESQVEAEVPLIWALTLIVAVIPAILLLLGVRWAADRFEPGYGTAAAVTLGLCTVVMAFASEYFSHVIAAGLGFAAFLLLMREREGPSRPWLVAAAGLMAGLAVTFEFQVGLVGIVLFAYAVSRSGRPLDATRRKLGRAAAYGAGALAGAMPMLLFNLWAFGNPLKLAYGDAVDEPGLTGHDKLGLNSHGFFGITAPKLDSTVELLLSSRGLLVLTPIVVMAVVGVVLMRRRGHRSEANVILAVAAVYFLYNAGYWLPMGGGTLGPRFLVPALPFIAIGLAFSYRRFPALTLALAIPSALFMLVGTLTFPLLGDQGTGIWADWLRDGDLEHTLLTVVGVSNAWLAIAPVVALAVATVVLAWRATPASPVGMLWPAAGAVVAWAAVSAFGPTIAGSPTTPIDGGNSSLALIAAGALGSLGLLAAFGLRRRLGQPGVAEPSPGPPGASAPREAVAGERIR